MASGAALQSMSMARGIDSMPAKNAASLKKPWSTATSRQRDEIGLKSLLSRYVFKGRLIKRGRTKVSGALPYFALWSAELL